MTRLGSRLPFREAAKEVWYSQRTRVCEATVRRLTHHHGAAVEELARQKVEMLMRDAPESLAHPQQLLVSADGSFVHLTIALLAGASSGFHAHPQQCHRLTFGKIYFMMILWAILNIQSPIPPPKITLHKVFTRPLR